MLNIFFSPEYNRQYDEKACLEQLRKAERNFRRQG